MHKNALFYLKIAKIAQRWGLRPQTPLLPAAGGFVPRPPPKPLTPLRNPGYATGPGYKVFSQGYKVFFAGT